MEATEAFEDYATPRQKRRWGKQASLAAIALGAIGSFVVVSRTIQGSKGNAFDRAVIRAAGRARHPVSNALARAWTSFGGVVVSTVIATSAVGLARRRPHVAAQIVLGAIGGIVAELGVKRFFLRKRPAVLEHLERVTSSSYPSGHAMAAASLYLTLGFVASRGRESRRQRGAILAAASAFATSVGGTRVFLGVHWPTDVIGGLALGTAWASAAEALFDLPLAARAGREALPGRASTP